MSKKTLRPYQSKAIRETYASMRSNRRTMMQLPTGAGKSFIAESIMEHGLKHGRRIAFLVDRIVLSDQIFDSLFESGLPISVMQGDHPMFNPSMPIQICSIQTLQKRGRKHWPEVDLFFQDEAHIRYTGVQEIMDTWNNIPWIGLSATPFTPGLGLMWDNLVIGATTKELIDQGYLADYVAYGPSAPDLTNVRRSGNDFSALDLEERMSALTGDIVAHYQKFGDGKKGLYFTPTVAYAQYLADEFNSNGIMADHVSGYDTDERRRRVLDQYASGEIKVVCNCDVLTRGFDQPDIEIGGLARPTRSLSLHIQMLGRFLRKHDDETKIILDHSGNIERLGFPDDDLPTTLDMARPGTNSDTRDRNEPQPWNCPKCTFLVPAGTNICPTCGHQARRRAEVEVRSGVLTKLESSAQGERELKQDVYSQLLGIARKFKYSDGWAAHKYKKLFDVWPRKVHATPKEPTPDMMNWVKSENIRHAKRRR